MDNKLSKPRYVPTTKIEGTLTLRYTPREPVFKGSTESNSKELKDGRKEITCNISIGQKWVNVFV